VSFEDSDIVRSAIHLEGFRDDEFDYQLLRALGLASFGGSTVGECLSAAAAITDGSPKSWAAEFGRLAERVEGRGRACLEAGHVISGRDHLLRASTYYRMAEYYAEGTVAAPEEIGLRSERCFADAAAFLDPPVHGFDVPFDGGRLPGYFASGRVGASQHRSVSRPTLVVVGGFDSSAEELYFRLGAAGAERGWNVFCFDGPGQPGCMRADPPLTFRPDYEMPLGAVLDALSARPDVDADRLAITGHSFGSYFAARAAAVDRRVRALVVDPPMVDMGRYMEAWVGRDTFRMASDIRPEDVIGVPEDLMPRQMQWGIAAICHRFGVPSFHAWRSAVAQYRLGDMLGDIRCPVLALAGDREGDEPRDQLETLVSGASGPVSPVVFTAEDGASTHGQSDNLPLLAQVTYDWLDEVIGT
jgi:alpha-beta hydrolase superfamily lysophospholipase